MIDMNWVAAPLIGGAIGLLTNGLAIRMLFRPLRPVKVGNYTLPFTPGLIPKEKDRIAHAIGQTVGRELLDTKTLQNALESEGLKDAIYATVDRTIEKIGSEQGTLLEYLDRKGLLTYTDRGVGIVGERASEYIVQAIGEKEIGEKILDFSLVKVMEGLNPMVAMMAEPAIESARPVIVQKIDELVAAEAPDIIRGYMKEEYSKLLDKQMVEFGIWLWTRKDTIKERVWEIYEKLVEEKSASVIGKLDVATIVEDKIKEMDVAFLEKLVLGIAKKELNSLVWIGGLLGMVIGFVNVLF